MKFKKGDILREKVSSDNSISDLTIKIKKVLPKEYNYEFYLLDDLRYSSAVTRSSLMSYVEEHYELALPSKVLRILEDI